MWDAWEVRLEEMSKDPLLLNPGYALQNIFYTYESCGLLGKIIDLLVLQHVFFSPFQDIRRIMQGIKFDDPQSAVAFRGVTEAFSSLSNVMWLQSSPAPFQGQILVSVQEISLKENNLEAVTLLGERITINNRSRNDFQNSSIQEKKLPIRKPMSERDVGDLILLSPDPNQPHLLWPTCTGILLSGG